MKTGVPFTWPERELTPWLTALAQEKIAVAPAEGMYGYVADPFSDKALTAILKAKKRDAAKGLIVLLPDLSWLGKFCPIMQFPAQVQAYIDACWLQPTTRPVTLLLPALPSLSPLLTGGQPSIALRLPATNYLLAYLKAYGAPLVSTSLNLTGQPPALTAAAAQKSAGQAAPKHTPLLTLPTPLNGTPSRIFNPLTAVWLR